MRSLTSVLSCGALVAVGATPCLATSILYDKDNLSFSVGGFAQLDAFSDSTRSLGELEGNSALEPKGTRAGEHGRLTFSTRNSRLSFGLQKIRPNGVKTRGYIEMDLLGYEPKPEEGTPEAAFFQNPTVRMRHVYLKVEGDSWSILAGQTWSLFGWQSEYLMSTVSDTAGAGALFERLPQITAMKEFNTSSSTKLLTAFSIERPLQRDSGSPNLVAGLKLKLDGPVAPYTLAFGEIKPTSASIGISGTTRTISYPQGASVKAEGHKQVGAVAVDAMIPLVGMTQGGPSGNTLALSGEFTKGSGYGDECPNWTGNVAGPSGTIGTPPDAGQPLLDAGVAGYSKADGGLKPIHLQTWNWTLQYHLPEGLDTWTTSGFGELWSDNAADLIPAKNRQVYSRTQIAFWNVVHNFTDEVRLGLEYNWYRIRFADNSHAINNRVQLTSWYRF